MSVHPHSTQTAGCTALFTVRMRRLRRTDALLSKKKYGNRRIWCAPRVVPVVYSGVYENGYFEKIVKHYGTLVVLRLNYEINCSQSIDIKKSISVQLLFHLLIQINLGRDLDRYYFV